MARMILSLNGQTLAEYNLSKERYTVGRLPDNDIRIDNPAVSGHHSLVINILNDSFLEDLNSTNGTYVNGKLIKKHALAHGDVITVGHHQLRFVDDGMEDAHLGVREDLVISTRSRVRWKCACPPTTRRVPPQPRYWPGAPARLQVLTGVFAGREMELKKPVTTLGRPGVQVVGITRRGEIYSLVVVDGPGGARPWSTARQPDSRRRKLHDNDVIEVAGVKMGFFTS
jgi:predicted component of type VI protein secretion system